MIRIYLFVMVVLAGLILFVGCDRIPSKPEFDSKISIYGFLHGNQPLSEKYAILITTTQPPEAYYDINAAAVRGAEITLTDMTNGISYPLTATSEKPAFFYNPAIMIQPNTTYRLSVTLGDETIEATTTVPFELVLETKLDPDSVNDAYHENLGYDKPIYIECDNEEQLVLVNMYCNEMYQNARYIYPFQKDLETPSSQEDYDGGVNGAPRHIMAMVPYKYLIAPNFENRHTIFWYASMIVFYGSNTLGVLSIDENYHHYLTGEHPVLSGGVENGIGVFGSVCGEDYELNILE
jgi:hypothetical protein